MKTKSINPNIFGWDNETFIKEEKEYRAKEREFNSSVDWLEVFPDAKTYISNRSLELKIEITEIKTKFAEHLTLVDSKCSVKEQEMHKFLISILYMSQITKRTKQLQILANTARKHTNNKQRKINNNSTKGFSLEEIEEARNSSIVSLFEQDGYVLKKSGANLVTMCPFHSESTPSCTIYCNENRYYCYGCNAKGNSIDYLMKLHQMSFIESVKILIGKNV